MTRALSPAHLRLLPCHLLLLALRIAAHSRSCNHRPICNHRPRRLPHWPPLLLSHPHPLQQTKHMVSIPVLLFLSLLLSPPCCPGSCCRSGLRAFSAQTFPFEAIRCCCRCSCSCCPFVAFNHSPQLTSIKLTNPNVNANGASPPMPSIPKKLYSPVMSAIPIPTIGHYTAPLSLHCPPTAVPLQRCPQPRANRVSPHSRATFGLIFFYPSIASPTVPCFRREFEWQWRRSGQLRLDPSPSPPSTGRTDSASVTASASHRQSQLGLEVLCPHHILRYFASASPNLHGPTCQPLTTIRSNQLHHVFHIVCACTLERYSYWSGDYLSSLWAPLAVRRFATQSLRRLPP